MANTKENIEQQNTRNGEKGDHNFVKESTKNPIPPTKNMPDTERKIFFEKLAITIQAAIAVLMLCTLVLVWKQTDIFKSQLLNQSRAWITVKEASYFDVEEGKQASAKVVMFNSGNTPATDVSIHNNIVFREKPFPNTAELASRDGRKSLSVIGPNVPQISFVTQRVTLTKENIEDFKAEKLRLYVWGRIKYKDIFNSARETGFCLVSKTNSNMFEACENNNYAN